ncbi:OprO/OprP family phosphate-selective porin [Gemmata massiliana]|nr:porin [Gemmata massiliana]
MPVSPTPPALGTSAAPPTATPPMGAAPTADPMQTLDALRAPPPAPASAPSSSNTPLNDFWRNGLRFESADKAFSLAVGGRVQFDAVSYLTTTAMRRNVPGNNPLEDGVSFRRFRFDVGGTIYKNIEFYAQIDFVNGFVTSVADNRQSNVPAPTDLWVTYKDLPWVGNIRVGNQKPLYSFEHLTSSRFLTFLERSLGFDAFAEGFNNGFSPGITMFDTFAEKRGTWGVGVFKNTRSIFAYNVGRNETEVNGRVTYLPVYEDDGKLLVHVGLGAAARDLDQDQARFRARLDARNSPSAFSPLVADTGLFFGNHQQILVPELVAVMGSWSFQSEYYASWVGHAAAVGANNQRLADQGTVFMQSAYGEVAYFLTGEHREYNRETGTFTRVSPKTPVTWTRSGFTGCGGWQVAARYTYLDLNDKVVRGGQIHDMTLGLNWFLNPNMKIQSNYFLTARNAVGGAGDGLIHGFAVRTAIDF